RGYHLSVRPLWAGWSTHRSGRPVHTLPTRPGTRAAPSGSGQPSGRRSGWSHRQNTVLSKASPPSASVAAAGMAALVAFVLVAVAQPGRVTGQAFEQVHPHVFV